MLNDSAKGQLDQLKGYWGTYGGHSGEVAENGLEIEGIKLRSNACSYLVNACGGGSANIAFKNADGLTINYTDRDGNKKLINVYRDSDGSVVNAELFLTASINPGDYLGNKAPYQVTPGVNSLSGQYVNNQGRVEPWTAYYDQYGRLVGRTDYNAGNKAQGKPDIHYHIYKWGPGKTPEEVESHLEGEYKP